MPDPVQAMGGGGGPSGSGFATVGYLTSPKTGLAASMGDILDLGTITVGPSGNIIFLLNAILIGAGINTGVHCQLLRDGATAIILPDLLQESGSDFNNWEPVGLSWVDPGLTPGNTHTYKLQASFAGSTSAAIGFKQCVVSAMTP